MNLILSYITIVQRDTTQNSLFIILQVHSTCFLFIILQDHSTCFGCQPHPSSGVHKNVAAAYGTTATSLQRGRTILATLEGGSCTKIMTSTGGCSYSFVYSS